MEANPDGGAWLSDLSRAAARNAIVNMGAGIKSRGGYCKVRKRGEPTRKVGFPGYRKRHRRMACTAFNGRNTIRVDGRKVRLPVVGCVRMREELRWAEDIGEVAVSKVGNRWLASIQVHTGEGPPPPQPGPAVGVDMGVKTLATVWDGVETTDIANPRVLAGALKSLRRLDPATVATGSTQGAGSCTSALPA